MSCYAFLKKWLLPNLFHDSINSIILLTLNINLKSLTDNLGCFPLDNRS